jgi:hypothetical protein
MQFMTEDEIKSEMRLFALESLVCQQSAILFQLVRGSFEIARQQMKSGTQRPVFGGDDPALSDLLSAELEQAMDRLYKIIETHLGTARKQAQGQ